MARGLLDLPAELQTAVAWWILRPSEVAKLCLVSRQLRDVAMPLLYRSMYLNVDDWKTQQLDRFLAHGHPGHRHVRSLDIDSDELKTEAIALKVAKDALHILPRDCLMSFRCPLETGIDNDLMILLSANQRKLLFLGLGPLMNTALNIPDCLRPWPLNIQTVVIPWKLNASVDVDFYQQLIERSGKTLRALTIRTETFCGSGESIQIFGASASAYLAKGLSKHCMPGGHWPKLELNDVNFQNQDLRTAGTLWLRCIDFTNLRTMQMWNCNNVDDLLTELQELNRVQRLRLHGLVLSSETSSQAPRRAQEFVGAIAGLQYLNLCYLPEEPKETSFSIRCLEGHKDSIKDLYVGVGSNYKGSRPLHVMSSEDLQWLSSNCLRLSQLAIALPRLRLDEAFAGRWGDYGLALEYLASLPRLKILRILSWPVVSGREFVSFGDLGASRHLAKVYLKKLDIIATSIARIFSSFRSDNDQRLSVITFGSAEAHDVIADVDYAQDHLFSTPVTYKVKRKETEFGFLIKAKRVDARLMEYEEPIAFVVDEDTDQGLSLEGYSWGSGYYA